MQIPTALSYPGCALPSPPPLCTSMKGTIYLGTGCCPPRPSLPTSGPAQPYPSVTLTLQSFTPHLRLDALRTTLAGRSARTRTGLPACDESAPHPAPS